MARRVSKQLSFAVPVAVTLAASGGAAVVLVHCTVHGAAGELSRAAPIPSSKFVPTMELRVQVLLGINKSLPPTGNLLN